MQNKNNAVGISSSRKKSRFLRSWLEWFDSRHSGIKRFKGYFPLANSTVDGEPRKWLPFMRINSVRAQWGERPTLNSYAFSHWLPMMLIPRCSCLYALFMRFSLKLTRLRSLPEIGFLFVYQGGQDVSIGDAGETLSSSGDRHNSYIFTVLRW